MSFPEKLNQLRGNRTFRELERITGLSHTYLATLEKGIDPRSGNERKPTPDVLRKLSETLNVDYIELMIAAGYITLDDFETKGRTTLEEANIRIEQLEEILHVIHDFVSQYVAFNPAMEKVQQMAKEGLE